MIWNLVRKWLRIAAEKAIAIKEQEKAEEVGKRTADQEKAVGIAQEKSKQEIAEQKKLTQEKDMDVIQVKTVRQAEIDKQEVVIKANAGKDKQRIEAEAGVIVAGQQKEAQRIEAEAKVLVAEQNEKAATHDAQAAYVKMTKEAEANLVAAKNEAEGIEAKGSAEATAKEKLGNAEVAPQIMLAKEIGNNEGYQQYLIEIRKVDAIKEVGVEQAKNLGNADIKIIANAGGNLNEGVNSVMELFSAKGGQNLGSMLEALAGSELGQQLLNKVIKKDDADDANTGKTSKK